MASAVTDTTITTANTVEAFDAMSEVKTFLGLLPTKTTETAKVLVGTDITESTEAIMNAFLAIESFKSWPLSNVGLNTFKA